MRTVSIRLADLMKSMIPIGFVGENEHTRVVFDCKKVFDDYPSAVPALTVSPPSGSAYPAVTVRDGDIVTWDVADSDLAKDGIGEIQLAFTQDSIVAKSYVGRIRIDKSIIPSGSAPTPVANWLIAANTALNEIPQDISDGIGSAMGAITAEAETLEAGSSATAAFESSTKVLTLGIPKGDKGDTGDPGQDGQDGEDGYSPTATVSKSGSTAMITITDANGTTTATVSDGEDGADGQDGEDGFSPVATVSKSGTTATISITDANGTTTAEVSDGDPTTLIDDTAGDGDTDKAWSADKLTDEFGDLKSAIPVVPASSIPWDIGGVANEGLTDDWTRGRMGVTIRTVTPVTIKTTSDIVSYVYDLTGSRIDAESNKSWATTTRTIKANRLFRLATRKANNSTISLSELATLVSGITFITCDLGYTEDQIPNNDNIDYALIDTLKQVAYATESGLSSLHTLASAMTKNIATLYNFEPHCIPSRVAGGSYLAKNVKKMTTQAKCITADSRYTYKVKAKLNTSAKTWISLRYLNETAVQKIKVLDSYTNSDFVETSFEEMVNGEYTFTPSGTINGENIAGVAVIIGFGTTAAANDVNAMGTEISSLTIERTVNVNV